MKALNVDESAKILTMSRRFGTVPFIRGMFVMSFATIPVIEFKIPLIKDTVPKRLDIVKILALSSTFKTFINVFSAFLPFFSLACLFIGYLHIHCKYISIVC